MKTYRIALPLLAATAVAGLAVSHHFTTAAHAQAVQASDIITVPLEPVVPANQRQCSAKTASSLGYSQLRPGTGAMPGKDDYALVGYIGYLAADGKVFDQNPRAAFPVGGVVPGFSEGLQRMTKGSVMRLCIPAALGYGAKSTGPIPANADLVFQVELLDFKTAAEIEAMQKAQAAAQSAPAEAAPKQ